MTDTSDHVSMQQVLRNLAEALRDLEGLAGEIDTTVADLVVGQKSSGTMNYQMLQKVDLLFQSLGALRQVAQNATPFGQKDAVIDRTRLVHGVLLESMRERCSRSGPEGGSVPALDDILF